MTINESSNINQFLSGGGEMGAFIRLKDWSKTSIGDVKSWPQSLRTTLGILLNSKFPMCLWWGPELICFYNDAYGQILDQAGNHALSLGEKGEKVCGEMWHIIKPLIDQVISAGECIWSEDQFPAVYCEGKIEDVHWTFSYSPVYDEPGTINGVLVACHGINLSDTTDHKLSEERDARLAAIVQSSDDAIISKKLDGTIISWNDSAQRIFGYKADEIIGHNISKLIPQGRINEELEIIFRLKKGERVEHCETHYRSKDGKILEVSLSASPIKDSNGDMIGISKIIRDITEQKRTERIISENEERLQIVIDASELGTWELNLETKEFNYSKRYLEILGYKNEDSPDHSEFIKHVYPDDLLIGEKAIKKAFETGSLNYVSRIIWNDSTTHWVETKGKVFYNEHKKPIRLIGTARDVTEEKNYNQRLEESEKRFRAVANTAPVLIWMAGTDMQCNFCNKAWLEFTGRTIEQEQGLGWAEGIHPDDLQRCIDTNAVAFKNQDGFHIEYRLKRHDGEYRWVSDTGVPRYTATGLFEGYIGACMDIHDRILFEEKLQESESRLRIAALSSELGTWDYNPLTEVLRWDDATKKLFGVDKDTPITLDLFWSKMHPDDREPASQKMIQALNPDIANTYDAEYRTIGWPDNKVRWIHAKGKAFFTKDRIPYYFAGTILDITDKRMILEELKDSEQKFRLLADSIPQFVWTGDAAGNLNYYNQSVYDYSGLSPEQVFSEGWLQIVHLDDREQNMKEWMHAVNTGEPFLFEHRFRRYDGEYRWQLSRAIPQKDDKGNIQMWVGSSTDIHDQKTFSQELENKVQERTKDLQQANHDLEKMNEELASFAYVSSHDLQEPLRKIQTFANRVIEKETLSDTGKDYFRRMQDAAQRMQLLIEDLLAYSRTTTTEKIFEKTDLNQLLKDVRIELEQAIKEKQAIIHFDPLPELNIIPFQFRQLFTNIIVNSLKFSKKEVAPVITIKATVIKGNETSMAVLNSKMTYHQISISDNGIGFAQEYSTRIFEVFQRLHGKSEYKGTGIGLAICKKIVENHQGVITAHGELGKGTTIYIFIPKD